GDGALRGEQGPLEAVAAARLQGEVGRVAVLQLQVGAAAERPDDRGRIPAGVDAVAELEAADEAGDRIVSARQLDGEVVDTVLAADARADQRRRRVRSDGDAR